MIVFNVCHYREEADRIDRFNQQQLAAQSIDNAVNALKAAAIELGRYKSFLEKIDYELGKLQLQKQHAAAILQSFKLDRGRHDNPTHTQVAQSLYSWCDSERRRRRGDNPKRVIGEPYTLDIDREDALDAGEIASLPAITAICIAGFPEAFETRKNPVRNVSLKMNKRMSHRDMAVSAMLTE